MADSVFSRRFLRELAEWEGQSSPRDRELLEQALAAIGENPLLSGRVPSFYDPSKPSYLYRAGPLLIHYRLTAVGAVEFMNLFFRHL